MIKVFIYFFGEFHWTALALFKKETNTNPFLIDLDFHNNNHNNNK